MTQDERWIVRYNEVIFLKKTAKIVLNVTNYVEKYKLWYYLCTLFEEIALYLQERCLKDDVRTMK